MWVNVTDQFWLDSVALLKHTHTHTTSWINGWATSRSSLQNIPITFGKHDWSIFTSQSTPAAFETQLYDGDPCQLKSQANFLVRLRTVRMVSNAERSWDRNRAAVKEFPPRQVSLHGWRGTRSIFLLGHGQLNWDERTRQRSFLMWPSWLLVKEGKNWKKFRDV